MNDLTYVKGNVFDNVPDEFALSSFGYIKRDINDIKNEYIRLGFHLAECKRYRYYEQFGYDNFNEFVFSNFGLEKSSLSRCLSVYERFAMCEGPFSTPKMFIDKKYSDFSYSQLCEMVSMSDDMVKRVNPDMTISQIRALKKGISSFGCDVATVNEVTHTKDFDYDKYISLSGAALYSYVKSCHSSSRLFFVFDASGKPVDFLNNHWFDVLENKDGRIVIRLTYAATNYLCSLVDGGQQA